MDELRPYAEQKALLQKPAYAVYGWEEDGALKGFFALYEWADLLFIEHFAVAKAYRNQGLGEKMLQALLAPSQKTACLEVELPETELARRRIRFYERNGFVCNEYPYIQPAISAGRKPLPLRVMSYKSPLQRGAFDLLVQRIYREVYGK